MNINNDKYSTGYSLFFSAFVIIFLITISSCKPWLRNNTKETSENPNINSEPKKTFQLSPTESQTIINASHTPLVTHTWPAYNHYTSTPFPFTPSPTIINTVSPTNTPNLKTNYINILNYHYIVDYERIIIFTFVENTSDKIILNSPYQISIYDKNDELIQAASGIIGTLLPKQTSVITDIVLTPRKAQYAPKFYGVEKIDVQIQSGKEILPDSNFPSPLFEIVQKNYIPHDTFPKITGLIQSNANCPIKMIAVTALVFDKNHEIIGGGLAYIPLILPQEIAPVEIGIARTQQQFQSIELYPILTNYNNCSD